MGLWGWVWGAEIEWVGARGTAWFGACSKPTIVFASFLVAPSESPAGCWPRGTDQRGAAAADWGE